MAGSRAEVFVVFVFGADEHAGVSFNCLVLVRQVHVKLVDVLQVHQQRAFGAVHFQALIEFAAGGGAAGLEGAADAALVFEYGAGEIVGGDLLGFAGLFV